MDTSELIQGWIYFGNFMRISKRFHVTESRNKSIHQIKKSYKQKKNIDIWNMGL